MRRPTTHRLRRAFTLIELLVAISIIAILASMTMGSISIVRDQAKKAQCRNNLRSLALAAIGYTNDNEGLFSLAANHSWSDSQWPAGLATSGSPSSAFPSACVNSYYSGAVQPYLYATLIDYDIVPVSPGARPPATFDAPYANRRSPPIPVPTCRPPTIIGARAIGGTIPWRPANPWPPTEPAGHA